MGDSTLPSPIHKVLSKYRELRHTQSLPTMPPRQFWDRNLPGPGTMELRRVMGDLISGPDICATRERLLLESTKRGYKYLVLELLCGKSPCVSLFTTDAQNNSLLHLAILSKNTALVKWLLKHIDGTDGKTKLIQCMNQKFESPFSLAIRGGKLALVMSVAKSLGSLRITNLDSSIKGLLGDQGLSGNSVETSTKIKKLWHRIVEHVEGTIDAPDKIRYQWILTALCFLDARFESHIVVRDAIDKWARGTYLRELTNEALFATCKSAHDSETSDCLQLSTLQKCFGGILYPWWDASISAFQVDVYSTARTEDEQCDWFNLLLFAISEGHVDTATWLLTYFKAPPSLLSCRGSIYDGTWYLRRSAKLVERAVTGWISERLIGPEVGRPEDVIDEVMGSNRPHSNMSSLRQSLMEKQWTADFGEDGTVNVAQFWKEVCDNGPKSGYLSFSLNTVKFASVRLVCASPSDDFENSEHATLLAYFLLTVYNEYPNFVAADLPSLAKFVTLDHLNFFQFLTKARNYAGRQEAFLQSHMPLLFPLTSLSHEHEGMDTGDDDRLDTECSICLEPMAEPFMLKCGHSFHRRCLFWYIFPSLRNDTSDGRLTHKALAENPHLSYTLGKSSCPYCRQSVKPSLAEALALNLTDGLRRTAEERRTRPYSPHLDVANFPMGITVGQALLALAACSGAIGIFQWLVVQCGIQPEAVNVDDMNIMHHAVIHKQIIIFRWLIENGYASMLFGGMERKTFDHYMPPNEQDPVLPALNEESCERMQFWAREFRLAQLHGYDLARHKPSDSEMKYLTEGLHSEDIRHYELQHRTERQSPIHYLLMNSFEGFDYPGKDWFFKFLKFRNISAVPVNWCQLVLAVSIDSTMRSAAKTYLAQKVLTMPDSIRGEDLHRVLPSCAQAEFDDVLAHHIVDYLSPLTVAGNPDHFNLWKLLLRGEKDWRPFLQVAKAVNMWTLSPCFEFLKTALASSTI